MPRSLGLKPRSYNPAIPHWSAYSMMRSRRILAPPTCNNYDGMASDSSMLGNDQWGDCAEAMTYREVEVLTYKAAGKELVPSDQLALGLYSAATGFDPNAGPPDANPTDQGTNLQDLLTYRVKNGILLPDGTTSKLVAFFELDFRNLNDCRLAVEEGGFISVGINCYQSFMDVQQGGEWAPPGPNDHIIGGHAIGSGAYDQHGFTIKSWGMDIYMPIATAAICVTEAYVVVSQEWLEASGKTPLGMTLAQYQAAMSAL